MRNLWNNWREIEMISLRTHFYRAIRSLTDSTTLHDINSRFNPRRGEYGKYNAHVCIVEKVFAFYQRLGDSLDRTHPVKKQYLFST